MSLLTAAIAAITPKSQPAATPKPSRQTITSEAPRGYVFKRKGQKPDSQPATRERPAGHVMNRPEVLQAFLAEEHAEAAWLTERETLCRLKHMPPDAIDRATGKRARKAIDEAQERFDKASLDFQGCISEDRIEQYDRMEVDCTVKRRIQAVAAAVAEIHQEHSLPVDEYLRDRAAQFLEMAKLDIEFRTNVLDKLASLGASLGDVQNRDAMNNEAGGRPARWKVACPMILATHAKLAQQWSDEIRKLARAAVEPSIRRDIEAMAQELAQ